MIAFKDGSVSRRLMDFPSSQAKESGGYFNVSYEDWNEAFVSDGSASQ